MQLERLQFRYSGVEVLAMALHTFWMFLSIVTVTGIPGFPGLPGMIGAAGEKGMVAMNTRSCSRHYACAWLVCDDYAARIPGGL